MQPENSFENAEMASSRAFQLRDCALLAIATGSVALTLKELRDVIRQIHPASIYHHFWGGLLQPRFEEREYNNDFAAWARHGLHDEVLAERLALLDPTEYSSIDELRGTLLELIDDRLDESERLPWIVATLAFEFVRTQTVAFDTHQVVREPEDLVEVIPGASTGTIFYHFIDARRRQPIGIDDFSSWLTTFGHRHEELVRQMADIDPYFVSLTELRTRIAATLSNYFGRHP